MGRKTNGRRNIRKEVAVGVAGGVKVAVEVEVAEAVEVGGKKAVEVVEAGKKRRRTGKVRGTLNTSTRNCDFNTPL